MKKFWLSISPYTLPSYIDPEDDLAVLRERILQFILLAASTIGILAVISNIFVIINNQTYGLLILYFVLYSGLLAITLGRHRFSFRVRALGFLVIPYLLGMTGLLQYGLAGNGRLLLLAFSLLAASLIGLGAASITVFINIVTLMIAAAVRTTVNPLTAAAFTTSDTGADWISAILLFILITALTVGSLQLILYGLQRVIVRQKSLAEELSNERASLTEQVERRTQQLTSRAAELEAANQISQIITRETKKEALCDLVVNQIVDRLNFYYATIFLLDERNEYAVMQAGTGNAGQELLARHHSLKVGEIGMVGYVVSRGEIKVAQNVFLDPIHYKNPLLPDTQSEIAIPLITSNKIIGALDVQSKDLDAFTPESTQTLQTISDQLATALDRLKLAEQLRDTREQLDIGYRQFTQSAWKSFLESSRRTTAYQYRKGEGARAPLDPKPTLTAEKILKANHPEPITTYQPVTESGKVITTLAIPVMLRNQILGVIDVQFDGDRISEDTLSLLESASTRLAIALENARLLEESQNRANREHLVSGISARVRGSTEVNGILQTAAEELGRVLGVSEVLVQLRSSSNE